ncbi:hypothetical protein [Streptomyces sp. NPDC058572]|uniref:hypothetical protein n=1 Tax=Streptomyces sp. NPDC058572 TaxID=3346546 RepID=UPI003669CEE0
MIDRKYILAECIAQGLADHPAALETWRHLMAVDLSFFKSPISEEIRDEGRAEGRAKGRAEDILLILERRGVDVPDEAREQITGCGDLDTLSRWLVRAVTASSAEEIFTEE